MPAFLDKAEAYSYDIADKETPPYKTHTDAHKDSIYVSSSGPYGAEDAYGLNFVQDNDKQTWYECKAAYTAHQDENYDYISIQ